MKKLLLSFLILTFPFQSSAASSAEITQKIKTKKFESAIKGAFALALIPLTFYVSYRYMLHHAFKGIFKDSERYLSLIPGYPNTDPRMVLITGMLLSLTLIQASQIDDKDAALLEMKLKDCEQLPNS